MTKIEELKSLAPQQRAQCLEKLFKKNKVFFAGKYPSVAKLLRPGGASPFHINVTDDFLNIINTETGELCHPEAGLDRFAEMLGDWTHNAWVDLIEGRVQNYDDVGKYSKFAVTFQQKMLASFPGLSNRMKHRLINLPQLANGKHFSNPVVFMGVFHGLHIDHYLSRSQINNALFVEPDPARFVLSCYFLDYERISKRFKDLFLHIGEGLPDNTIEFFFKNSKVSGAVWMRVLPGYSSDKVDPLLRKIRLRWRQIHDVWHPADWRLQGMNNAMENIKTGRHIYARPKALSKNSRIAIVGAGPSLSNDLDWLKKNQDQFVIFAVHSVVSALQKSGINPDFQFSLDINPWADELFDRLQLDPTIPLVNTVNDLPGKFSDFNEVLMLVPDKAIHPVCFEQMVENVTPTTGNMALAFACHCKPEEIFLFGLDFGFKEAATTHVVESSVYQTEEQHRSMLFSGHLPVEANFDNTTIVTQSYFNLARLCAEHPIVHASGEVQVFNCSDGAKIKGTIPCSAEEIQTKPYNKAEDIELIRSMFIPLEKDVHWRSLPLDGAYQLEEYKKAMISELKMTKFNWLNFTKKIDDYRELCLGEVPRDVARKSDKRMEPYFETTDLLLNSWYRFLCFSNNASEWEKIYEEGFRQISTLIDDMSWPEGI